MQQPVGSAGRKRLVYRLVVVCCYLPGSKQAEPWLKLVAAEAAKRRPVGRNLATVVIVVRAVRVVR